MCIHCAAERRSRHRAWPKKKMAIQKTTKKALRSIQNQSKTDQKSIKNRPKSRSGGILEASWRRLGASWGVLEAFWGVLGGLEPSWWRLESILKRLGGVLGSSWRRPGAVLRTSWSVLGPLGASCGRLGSVLEVSCIWFSGQSWLNLGMLSRMSCCNWFWMDFASKNRCPNYGKSLNSMGKYVYFAFRLF